MTRNVSRVIPIRAASPPASAPPAPQEPSHLSESVTTDILSQSHLDDFLHEKARAAADISLRSKMEGDAREKQVPEPAESPDSKSFDPAAYTAPFCKFMTDNPTVWHAVSAWSEQLTSYGFTELSERETWSDKLECGGMYFFTRNGSGLIAFTIGSDYEAGNGAAMIAAHCDALSAKVKPISKKQGREGFVQLGVAQYGGALSQSWFDRDLGVGGRVFVKDGKAGKIEQRLVKLDHPIGRIPSIAPHFGLGAQGQANRETRMVPIVGLEGGLTGKKSDDVLKDGERVVLGGVGSFASTQPERLVKAIAGEIGVKDYSEIVSWDLEMFDAQPAQVGGLEKEFIFAGRIDDKLCSYAAIEALLRSTTEGSGLIKLVGLFDDEEVGSLLRQGARGNFLPSTIERIAEAFCGKSDGVNAKLYQTYANSFLVSADVCHAVNPNYLDVYLAEHTPRLNVGLAVSFDSNAHMTTDAASSSLFNAVAEKCDSQVQVFQIRNDSRSGGTVGPMLSAATGVRAIDAGIPQLSMHSIRATTGSLDPGLGVKMFTGFLEHFEEVDKMYE